MFVVFVRKRKQYRGGHTQQKWLWEHLVDAFPHRRRLVLAVCITLLSCLPPNTNSQCAWRDSTLITEKKSRKKAAETYGKPVVHYRKPVVQANSFVVVLEEKLTWKFTRGSFLFYTYAYPKQRLAAYPGWISQVEKRGHKTLANHLRQEEKKNTA